MENEKVSAPESIRRFTVARGAGGAVVQHVARAVNPYSGDCREMDIFEDDLGHEYWAETAERGGGLIQVAPSARAPQPAKKTRPEDRLPVAKLRERALDLCDAQRPGFRAEISKYHPLEDNRDREIYFFRFDDFSSPCPESELPPFIQAGLRADGRLVSFTCTLAKPAA